jgi:hypothetical protein
MARARIAAVLHGDEAAWTHTMSRTDRDLRDCGRTMSAALVAGIGLNAAETAPATGACWLIWPRLPSPASHPGLAPDMYWYSAGLDGVLA